MVCDEPDSTQVEGINEQCPGPGEKGGAEWGEYLCHEGQGQGGSLLLLLLFSKRLALVTSVPKSDSVLTVLQQHARIYQYVPVLFVFREILVGLYRVLLVLIYDTALECLGISTTNLKCENL